MTELLSSEEDKKLLEQLRQTEASRQAVLAYMNERKI